MKLSIKPKILLTVIILTALLAVVIVTFSTLNFTEHVHSASISQMQNVSQSLERDIIVNQKLALELVRARAYLRATRDALHENNKEKLIKAAETYKTKESMDFYFVLDMEGKVVADLYNPTVSGQKMDTPLIKTATGGKSAVVFDSSSASQLAIAAASPIFDPIDNAKKIGVLYCGIRLDSEEWVQRIQRLYNVDATTFFGKKRVNTTIINPKDGKPAVGTELTDPLIIDKVFTAKENYFGAASVFGCPYEVTYIPLKGGDGNVIGIVFAGYNLTQDYTTIKKGIMFNTVILIIGIVVFTLVLLIIISRITRPLHQMTAAAHKMTGGELDVDLKVETGDELQVLAEGFQKLAEALKVKTAVADQIANGDLTAWVPLASPHDALGIAFIQMRYNFYDSLKDLSSLVVSIQQESEALSSVNQQIITNTNHSASQLEEVSASIGELNSQTKMSSEKSRSAETRAQGAIQGTEKGLEQ
ncbi:MAG: cache domain-containing protein, partial [Planctomycetaceae bacterium]|nr:cache domain-containing protein [Planctomycetaceae bacterium]